MLCTYRQLASKATRGNKGRLSSSINESEWLSGLMVQYPRPTPQLQHLLSLTLLRVWPPTSAPWLPAPLPEATVVASIADLTFFAIASACLALTIPFSFGYFPVGSLLLFAADVCLGLISKCKFYWSVEKVLWVILENNRSGRSTLCRTAWASAAPFAALPSVAYFYLGATVEGP